MTTSWRWFWGVVVAAPLGAFIGWGLADNTKLFLTTALNGLTLGALYFLVASGFTLVFGLMRNVNLAHGSLYLLGAYVAFEVGDRTGSWALALATGFVTAALFGLLLQVAVFRFMPGQDLRQTLVTIALSIMLADLMLWWWGGQIYQFDPPRAIFGGTPLPLVDRYPTYRLVVLGTAVVVGLLLWWFLTRTRVGMMIRAGVDDRAMLAAAGVNVHVVFAITFAIGAGLAGFGGVVGGDRPVDRARRGHALPPRLPDGGDRGRHGQRGGGGGRRGPDRAGRAVRAGVRAHVRDRVHVRDPGAGPGVPAPGAPGSASVA
jgi:branched-chain amino acid transport system permease protein